MFDFWQALPVTVIRRSSRARSPSVQAALATFSAASTQNERGAVFTRKEIVHSILDLCGYDPAVDLLDRRFLEPACGEGEFLLTAASRLLQSCAGHHGPKSRWLRYLPACITAVELHASSYHRARERLQQLLQTHGLNPNEADRICRAWLKQDDFLLTELETAFDVIAGNPPYVRQERIPAALLTEYKRRYNTLYDRADLYIPFFERSLDALGPDGKLGFICANRWMKNKYGGPLRGKIAANFTLDCYIDLQRVDAFHEQVDAYPAITIIRRAPAGQTTVITELPAKPKTVRRARRRTPIAVRVDGVCSGRDPWLLDAPRVLHTIRALEHSLPTLEQAGAKVGIGVATGADRIFIGPYTDLPVEADCKLPLAMTRDLGRVSLRWQGNGVVNPWMPDGTARDLENFPQLATYLARHRPTLKERHTAKKSPRFWYKTIDRIYPALATTPKLLIPDIRGDATIVLDQGHLYPHHNLYFVTSDVWDLRALQAILRSSVALMFVAAYSVQMAGGFLRFQAQYLRRIRLPAWSELSREQRSALKQAAVFTDLKTIDEVVYPVYGLAGEAAQRVSTFAARSRVAPHR